MEEAVFSLRLKCRTGVPLQQRRPTERRLRGFSSIRKMRGTLKSENHYSTNKNTK